MPTTREPELRKLHHMRSEVIVMLIGISAALVSDNASLRFWVLCVNAFVWSLFLIEVQRDIAQKAPLVMESKAKEVRMKQH